MPAFCLVDITTLGTGSMRGATFWALGKSLVGGENGVLAEAFGAAVQPIAGKPAPTRGVQFSRGWVAFGYGVAQNTEADAYPVRCKVAIPWRANRAALRGYGASQRPRKQKRPTFR